MISEDYIKENNEYTEKLLDVSNNMIVFDLLNSNNIKAQNEEENK